MSQAAVRGLQCSTPRKSLNAPWGWPFSCGRTPPWNPASGSLPCWLRPGRTTASILGMPTPPPGRQAGLRNELVDALRDRKELPNPQADEAAVVEYGQQFFRTRRVSQEAFDAVVSHFGVTGATELTTLMGCYSMLAFNVNAFGVELPTELTEAPLPV